MPKLFIPPIKYNLLPPEIKILQMLRYFPIRKQSSHQQQPQNNRRQQSNRRYVLQERIISEHNGVQYQRGEHVHIRVSQIKQNGDTEVQDQIHYTLVRIVP